MAEKTQLDFGTISKRLGELTFPPIKAVVGILRGGRVPACLVAYQLGGLPEQVIGIRHRDDDNRPLGASPVETHLPDLSGLAPGDAVLLVDDVIVTGKTVELAKQSLEGLKVTTFALKGRADIVAFPEIEGCVHWPWNES